MLACCISFLTGRAIEHKKFFNLKRSLHALTSCQQLRASNQVPYDSELDALPLKYPQVQHATLAISLSNIRLSPPAGNATKYEVRNRINIDHNQSKKSLLQFSAMSNYFVQKHRVSF